MFILSSALKFDTEQNRIDLRLISWDNVQINIVIVHTGMPMTIFTQVYLD